jgi:hypothetical protein
MDKKEYQAADIAFRRRCLTVNSGIYARRYGTGALALLPEQSAVRRRMTIELDWLRSETCWTPQDERRIATLCAEILRQTRRTPEHLEVLWWHTARLRELLKQYAALAALERTMLQKSVWQTTPAHAPRRWAAAPAARPAPG